MTDVEAYQKLLIVLTSSDPIDYKGVLLRIAQLHPVAVVEAIDTPNPVASMITHDNDEEYILHSWRNSNNVIQTIKDLRTLRHERARRMGIDPTSVSGMDQCKGGLKVCKDDVENVLAKHNLNRRPINPAF